MDLFHQHLKRLERVLRLQREMALEEINSLTILDKPNVPFKEHSLLYCMKPNATCYNIDDYTVLEKGTTFHPIERCIKPVYFTRFGDYFQDGTFRTEQGILHEQDGQLVVKTVFSGTILKMKETLDKVEITHGKKIYEKQM